MRNKETFRGLIVEKDEEGKTSSSVQELAISQLPDGNVTISVKYSTLNYKDALCLGPGGGGLVRHYPHVPGIDFCGTVLSSEDQRYSVGDEVILTGWRVGETWWGGYAEKACVKGDWLVPLPKGLAPKLAMAVGTAGLTSMLAVMELEKQGLKAESGPILVTGAAGGVGSVAVAILSQLGYDVTAVTGREETEPYLKDLGARDILPRQDIAETIKRPLESEKWAGCIDVVGGSMLARILGQMKYGASVAAVGLAGGAALPATVIPFLLRGIRLIGIDSVMRPFEDRVEAWQRIVSHLPADKLQSMIREVSLDEIPSLGREILQGQVQGRIVVDVNR